MIYYIIYQSKPTQTITKESLNQITDESIKWNSNHGITGILLGLQDSFLQLLEGDEEDVKELFEMIKKDSRHNSISVRIRGFSKERIFQEWSMGSWLLSNDQLKNLQALQDIKAFMSDTSNTSLNSTRYMSLMNNLLETWITHEPERAKKLGGRL